MTVKRAKMDDATKTATENASKPGTGNEMMAVEVSALRISALDQAIKAQVDVEPYEITVKRAEAFYQFLRG